jgi:prophage maintenance system killer protein
MQPVFLSLDEVLEIHGQQIQRYGGSKGLRDAGALESAIATPQVGCLTAALNWKCALSSDQRSCAE